MTNLIATIKITECDPVVVKKELAARPELLRPPSSPLLQWSSGRRFCSEPLAQVDSGRSSLASLGSQESLEDGPEDPDVFSDSFSDDESDEETSSCCSTNNIEYFIQYYTEKWSEWTVPASKIHLTNSTVSSTHKEIIKRGYWHGSVWVHERSSESLEDVRSFVNEVNTLCKIRHENVQLFMGICLDLPDNKLGLIMSEIKGETLYSHIHQRGRNFTTSSKLKILRQISEGMEYLHAKGIHHAGLTSRQITIHHRVCISLSHQRVNQRKVESYELAYLPPNEIRKVIPATKGGFMIATHPTFVTDIFAFGTIVYELMTLRLPYGNEPLVDLVWNVGNNRCQPLTLLPKSKFRTVVSRCWNSNRPTSFKEILGSIQDNLCLSLRFRTCHSISTIPMEAKTIGK